MNMLKHFESMYTMSYILIQPCVSKCFLVFPPELQQFLHQSKNSFCFHGNDVNDCLHSLLNNNMPVLLKRCIC